MENDSKKISSCKFWKNVLEELNYDAPDHIKNIFEEEDLDHVSLRTFEESSFHQIELFVRSNTYKNLIPVNSDLKSFYGKYGRCPEEFSFSYGEKSVIRQIVQLVHSKSHDFWSFKTEDNEARDLDFIFKKIDQYHENFDYNSETNDSPNKKSSLLKILLKTLQYNSRFKSKNRNRYNDNLQLISAYIRMLGGKILYSFFAANAPIHR